MVQTAGKDRGLASRHAVGRRGQPESGHAEVHLGERTHRRNFRADSRPERVPPDVCGAGRPRTADVPEAAGEHRPSRPSGPAPLGRERPEAITSECLIHLPAKWTCESRRASSLRADAGRRSPPCACPCLCAALDCLCGSTEWHLVKTVRSAFAATLDTLGHCGHSTVDISIGRKS